MQVKAVVHCKKEPFDIYIGRPSKWGNPFIVGKHGVRGECVDLYAQWIRNQPELLAALSELDGKVIACWCKPNSCHGDVLAELLIEMSVVTITMRCGHTVQEVAKNCSRMFTYPCVECDARFPAQSFDPPPAPLYQKGN